MGCVGSSELQSSSNFELTSALSLKHFDSSVQCQFALRGCPEWFCFKFEVAAAGYHLRAQHLK